MTQEEEIDNYILNRMSEAERKHFEERLATNTELKNEVDFIRNTHHAVRAIALKTAFAKQEHTIQFKGKITHIAIVVTTVATIGFIVATIFAPTPTLPTVPEVPITTDTIETDTIETETIVADTIEPPLATNTTTATKLQIEKKDTTSASPQPTTLPKPANTPKADVEIILTSRETTQEEHENNKDEYQLWGMAAAAIEEQNWELSIKLLKLVIDKNGQHQQQAKELLQQIEENTK